MKKVRWILVGAGDIAKTRVASALSSVENSEIAAIFAPSVGKAEALAAEYHIPKVYHDFEQALAECDAECVYIASPHYTHVQFAKRALEAGRHFLCEKPLGINSSECLELLENAKKHPHLKTACSNYRLMTSQFVTTKRLIESGEIGDLLCGWYHDEEPYYNPSGVPLIKAKGKSPILGLGFYSINMAQHLFGLPESVFAAASSFNTKKLDPFDIEDITNIVLRFPGGRQFTILLNQASQAPLRHSCEFCGASGRILWPGCPPHFNEPVILTVYGKDGPVEGSVTPIPSGAEKPNWHIPMVRDFVESVLHDREPYCSLASAVKTSVITDAAFRSMKSGKQEPIEL